VLIRSIRCKFPNILFLEVLDVNFQISCLSQLLELFFLFGNDFAGVFCTIDGTFVKDIQPLGWGYGETKPKNMIGSAAFLVKRPEIQLLM
jgi:hypothetical protein